MTYQEKLKDPRWQKKRLEIMERDGFACCICQDHSSELNVHHRKYEKGLEPWECPDANLVTLCRGCHESVSKLKNDIGAMLDFEPHFVLFSQIQELLSKVHFSQVCDAIRVISKNPEAIEDINDCLMRFDKQ